jgi:type I restriction enzyme R subunit
MLLTGFDSQYLNTLYVDKNLRYHGLIQAFSRTNRILNDTKPFGQIVDFRAQQTAVDESVVLFSGLGNEAQAREIWLVEPAPAVVEKLKVAMKCLTDFMESQGLAAKPEAVAALHGNEARAAFVERFREVQRLKVQVDQYTDLAPEDRAEVEELLPPDLHTAFRGVYLETARRLRTDAGKGKTEDGPSQTSETPDFEFALFASADIDYDYIMALITRYANQTPGKLTLTRDQLAGLIRGEARLMDDGELIVAYLDSLGQVRGVSEQAIREGYLRFKAEREAAELAAVAQAHGLPAERLQQLVQAVLQRNVFDGERLTDLLEPLGLPWRARHSAELALMADLAPLLRRRAAGRDIAGLKAYEA